MEPKTLDDALAAFPAAYLVKIIRQENDGGFYFYCSRKQHGGEFTVMSETKKTWQEAFTDIWSKI